MTVRHQSVSNLKATKERRVSFIRQRGRPLSQRQTERLGIMADKFGINCFGANLSDELSSLGPVVRLEIGFGAGEHLIEQAQQNPDVVFVGIEPYLNGAATIARLLEETGLQNVRLFLDDARQLLEILPGPLFDAIYLLFPDPWPKKRHQKRRFINATNLDDIARVLVPNGAFWVATDHPLYCRWTLDHVRSHPAFEWTARVSEDWRKRPGEWRPTRYELKASKAGRPPVFLRFVRQ